MNNNDERDYEEENANRALMEEEMDDYDDYTTLDDYFEKYVDDRRQEWRF